MEEDELNIRIQSENESSTESIGHGGGGHHIPKKTYKITNVTTSGDQILRYSTNAGNFTPEQSRNALSAGHKFIFDTYLLQIDFFKDYLSDLSPENRTIFDQIPRTKE